MYTVSLLYTTVISSFTSFLNLPGWSVAQTRVLYAPRPLIDRAPGNNALTYTTHSRTSHTRIYSTPWKAIIGIANCLLQFTQQSDSQFITNYVCCIIDLDNCG